MTIIEAYERSYAQKNKAIRQNLATKQTELKKKKQRLQAAGEEELRLAYAKHMQATAMKQQQNRDKGRHGGAGDNAVAGLKSAHRSAQDQRLFELSQSTAAVDSELRQAQASAEQSIADNARALQLKKDQEQIKAEAAAAKAAAAAAKTSSSKKSSAKKSSSGSQSKSQTIIERMKNGEYDESFAEQLGWTDAQVRAYVNNVLKNREEKEGSKDGPSGTYKSEAR